jgi:tRNA(Met) cytidine acetyltransferase
MRELVERLREEAKRADERRLLVLAGPPDVTRARAATAIDTGGFDPAAITAVGTADRLPGTRLDPRRSAELLGTTRDAVVVDCHEACRPNALGRAVGAVDGGGLLVLLTPPLDAWPDRRDAFDESLAVPPFDVEDVAGNFRRRFVQTLRQHPGVAIIAVGEDDGSVRDGLTDPPTRTPPSPPAPPDDATFPPAAYEACLTADQGRAVAAFDGLREGVVVLEADRGRGKSSAAGLAAAAHAAEGRDVLVTAPQYQSAAACFERARELLSTLGDLAQPDGDAEPTRLETATGRIRFVDPVPAADLPEDPDLVVVDEAAALPVRLLERYLVADAVAFATTVHGYEGAGRGFTVRFRDTLTELDPPVSDVRLETPIRYAPGDPVEVWSFRALALDAGPAPDRAVADATPAEAAYEAITPAELLDDEALLREVFGLLVLAHYRTEPNDLARLLDAPNVSVRALLADGHVVSVALLAREGGLDASLRSAMYEGERVRGNMLPDVLTSQLRDETAGEPVGQRVMRIATHPAVRSRWLGSHLLEAIRAEFEADVDWLGVGYGATPALVDFWRDNGYRSVHLSTSRNDASGEHSAIMLDPCSADGEALLEGHSEWFRRRLPGMLADPLSDLDADVVRRVLRSVAGQPTLDLSPMEWRLAAGIPNGAASFDTAPRPVRRLAFRHLVDPAEPDLLSRREERLLVLKALQARPWTDVVERLDYHSHATCMRAIGEAIGRLVETYGDETAREELERFA